MKSDSNVIQTLNSISIFSELSPKEMELIAEQGNRISFQRGEVICFEDERGEDFYLVMEGKVKISLVSDEGKEVIISMRNAGEFFGEMALLEGKPRSASVSALKDTALFSFPKKVFLALLIKHPSISHKLLASLCDRLREADAKIRNLALLDVFGRVARTLLDLADREGKPIKGNMIAFPRPTHEQISKMIGTSRETVSRTMKALESQGFFTVDGREIQIPLEKLDH